MAWTTSESNNFNLQMLCEISSQNSISGSVMIVGLKINRLSSEHYTAGIISNVCSSIWHISHFRCTWIANWCPSQTGKVAKYTARTTPPTAGGIRKISFLLERQSSQSFVHPTGLTRPIFQAISMPGHCLLQLVIFEQISAIHQNCAPGFSFG